MSDPWPGMRVERESDDQIVTTGSVWRFERERIEVQQRIGALRPLARVRLSGAAAECRVRADSVLVLRARRDLRVEVDPLFEPLYEARHAGAWMGLDELGGVGLYPTRRRRSTWSRAVSLAAGEEAWVAAFPPRLPSHGRLRQRVAHEGRPRPFPDAAYPDADLIAESAAHCDVFCLHAYFWEACDTADRPRFGRYAGRRCSWRTRRHDPADPERFAALREAVRAAGMELVVYLSPQHSRAPDIGAEMERVVEEHDVDGLYLDGVAEDLVTLDRTVRRAREILGPRRVLYLNATNQPFGSPRVHAPFVDAWCDFVLRGDSGRGGLPRDRFLRWAVSGRNVSNAVGMWCHYGSAGRPVLRERMPDEGDVRACYAAGARLWRRAQAWREAGDDPAVVDRIVEEIVPRPAS